MSTGIQNYPNIEAPDSDYPDGSIRDKTISLPGTGVSKLVYDDIHQTFAKLLRDASITANGFPDNEYNGFQYLDAMKYLLGNNKRVVIKEGLASTTNAEADYADVVVCLPNIAALHTISMFTPTGSYSGKTTIANYSATESVDIYDQAGTNDINGVPGPFTLAPGKFIEFKYDLGTTNWVIEDYHLLDI